MKILDVCCGSKMMWLSDPQKIGAICGDVRKESITVTDNSHQSCNGVRHIEISPDCLYDFRRLPFRDSAFSLVVFDPPLEEWVLAKWHLKTHLTEDMRFR